MANTYKWKINGLEVYPSKDGLEKVVFQIHWALIAESDQKNKYGLPYSVDTIGTQIIEAPDADNFIVFDSLTQKTVEGWLEAILSKVNEESGKNILDNLKANLDKQLTEKITPTSVVLQLPSSE
jgi:hypothetical protein